ncbi:MAG: 16S rRNA (cytidine(1402)-2'-O)-methyltransferase [Puniceicoccales bacterium]|jgi:16S rRNA (cytidine1402-2'-O)-methyltransferase|nr:16S rRNA (cytidine(1402)-2'-O)-methyltransferase [Puniceicoccales bacterium]
MVLYIVATPIGNLGDISFRAIEAMRASGCIVCEDTRVSLKLLNKFGIRKPLLTCRDDNENHVLEKILDILHGGESVCLISDAGTPCVSDPGFRLVRACRRQGLEVEAIPGPCAAIAALSVSGLPTDGFLFVGFLPSKASARVNFFKEYINFEYTIIFYESCHRITKFLDDAHGVFGPERVVCIAKELTKIHGTIFVDKLSTVREKMAKIPAKGEFVAIVAPSRFVL